MAAALAFVTAICARLLADSFAVRNARLAGLQVHVELAFDPFNGDLQMCLAHTREMDLGGLWIACHTQRAILLQYAIQGIAHLVQIGLAFREERDRIAGLWKADRFQWTGHLYCVLSVSFVCVFVSLATAPKSPAGISVAGLLVFATRGVTKLAQALVGFCAQSSVDVIVRLQRARIDAERANCAHLRGGCSKDQEGERVTQGFEHPQAIASAALGR